MGGCCSLKSSKTVETFAVVNNNNNDTINPNPIIKPLSFDGEIYRGKCVKSYDGDTCHFNLYTKIGTHRWTVRLMHLDAPEIRTNNETEKLHAVACRDTLKHLILNRYCIVRCGKMDKYGRLLGEIYVKYFIDHDGNITTFDVPVTGEEEKENTNIETLLNVNMWMIHNTSCVEYEGKTKEVFDFSNDNPKTSKYHPLYVKYLNDASNQQTTATATAI